MSDRPRILGVVLFPNFESLDVPRTAEIPASRKSEFAAERERYRAMMDAGAPEMTASAGQH